MFCNMFQDPQIQSLSESIYICEEFISPSSSLFIMVVYFSQLLLEIKILNIERHKIVLYIQMKSYICIMILLILRAGLCMYFRYWPSL